MFGKSYALSDAVQCSLRKLSASFGNIGKPHDPTAIDITHDVVCNIYAAAMRPILVVVAASGTEKCR